MMTKFIAAFALLGAIAAPASGIAKEYANQDLLVSAQELMTMPMDDLVIVDVRPQEDYARGHIPGAVQFDPNAVAAANSPVDGALKPIPEIAGMIGGLGIGPKTRVVLYDDKGGLHAARMFWVMEYLGHADVALLDGGYSAWIAGGGALQTGTGPQVMAKRYTPAVTPRRFASADWILDRSDDAETVVVDVRPEALWAKGHIPWAKNIPWKGNLREDKTMKPEIELLAHFASLGVTRDKNIVVHCQNGLASAQSYFALRLIGFPRVRTYHRSWSEWGASDDLPRVISTGG